MAGIFFRKPPVMQLLLRKNRGGIFMSFFVENRERLETYPGLIPKEELVDGWFNYIIVLVDKSMQGAAFKDAEYVSYYDGQPNVRNIKSNATIDYKKTKRVPDGSGHKNNIRSAQAHGLCGDFINYHLTRSGNIKIDHTSRSTGQPILFVNVGSTEIQVDNHPLNQNEWYLASPNDPEFVKLKKQIFDGAVHKANL